ncbi:PREDICTED: chaoptin [Habropoda laboriosa]|uniref:chaoptin n=1 Tax=Habropoda laboriosa TaxID=597456 RepID=UPI00083CC34B|nr:PREDICTED: chaoptin [Habropoda laboriosa]
MTELVAKRDDNQIGGTGIVSGLEKRIECGNGLGCELRGTERTCYLALIVFSVVSTRQAEWIPCVELKRELQVPCKCALSTKYSRSIEMNCDRVVFTRDIVEGLRGQPIVSISQRQSGYQNLPEDLLNSSKLNLRKLDLSGNSIHRLMDRLLQAHTGLEELRLADNLLGDSLNPIFSSNEFHGMKQLKLLDLSRNGLRSIEEGILKGCESLEQLYLDGNNLTTVPTMSLKGPTSIRVLSLSGNNIGSVARAAFSMVGESVLRLDLSENELSHMEDDALSGLERLLVLNISRNDLTRFNSDVFKGAYNLLQLDLSTNFLREFPSDALRHLTELKFLNVSNNLIDAIDQAYLSGVKELQVLDLSRNNIGRLGVNAFSSLSELTRLDLSLNALRTIEESSFEGLTKLKWLSLQDNNILLVPATSLNRLPSLAHLHMEFNRVAALPIELIEATASSLVTLVLTRNLVREIPAGLFQDFEMLVSIELSGNMLTTIGPDTFAGLEETLLELDVSSNRLTSITGGELLLRKLLSLNLSGNRLTRIPPETFQRLDSVRYLNLSSNPLYGGFPPVLPSTVLDLDVSRTDLRILPAVLLLNLQSLERISLGGNRLEKIEEGTFERLENLSRIDLSANLIERIDNGAFVGLSNLYQLNLRGNRLSSFAGEHFDTGTGLELLDLSSNRIDRLSPTAFAIHPRLRELDLSDNRFLHFPSEYLTPLQFLERLDLSRNGLKRVGEFAFSQLGRLRTLNLAANWIESVEELAFHNSTQLQLLDLSGNGIEGFSERTMEGLLRLEHLDLRDNRLSSLPETIFEPSRVRSVESIDLSGNRLNEIPMKSLQSQAGSLSRLNLARNLLVELFSQEVASNVKELDLSDNPLSENAVNGLVGEGKILRSLNLANTGIERLTVRLETPFLKRLNLSGNRLTELGSSILQRATMLETLDVSRNRLPDFAGAIAALESLPALRSLDLSGNRPRTINESVTFDRLTSLRFLEISHLPDCTRIERNAFKPFANLRSLSAHDYPKLGYFDIQGILKGMSKLETLDIEIKDSSVGNEQLSIRSHPRLREVILRGDRLRSVLSSSLVGVRVPKLTVGIKNTSVDSMPAALFFPVPRSTELHLDISQSKFTTLSAQFLAALDERTGTVTINGLAYNPIVCNCHASQLWKWLRAANHNHRHHPSNLVRCSAPVHLAGSSLTNLTEDMLSCNNSSSTFYLDRRPGAVHHAVDRPGTVATPSKPTPANISGTDDTLIIGIVAGVVAFIALIVIVICVCRFRWSGRVDETRRFAAAIAASTIPDASVIRPASAYSGKINHDAYLGSYNGGSTLDRGNTAMPATSMPTTPVQIMPFLQPPIHLMHTLVPPVSAHPHSHSQSQAQLQQFYGYCEGSSLPIYVTCSTTQDTKCDR